MGIGQLVMAGITGATVALGINATDPAESSAVAVSSSWSQNLIERLNQLFGEQGVAVAEVTTPELPDTTQVLPETANPSVVQFDHLWETCSDLIESYNGHGAAIDLLSQPAANLSPLPNDIIFQIEQRQEALGTAIDVLCPPDIREHFKMKDERAGSDQGDSPAFSIPGLRPSMGLPLL